jgi:hypothetical protein
MKQLHYLLFLCLTVGQSLFAKETKFEFLNKTDKSVDVALGTRKYSPTMSSKTERIGAGGTFKEQVDPELFPQLLIKDPYAPGVAFVYEFRDKKDKDKPVTTNIYVRLLEKNGAASFERQTSTFGNLEKENIFLIKTLGSPQAAPKSTVYSALGVKENASNAEILGLSTSDAKDASKVSSAYKKLALKWHPDKNKTAGADAVFKLIGCAKDSLLGAIENPKTKAAICKP